MAWPCFSARRLTRPSDHSSPDCRATRVLGYSHDEHGVGGVAVVLVVACRNGIGNGVDKWWLPVSYEHGSERNHTREGRNASRTEEERGGGKKDRTRSGRRERKQQEVLKQESDGGRWRERMRERATAGDGMKEHRGRTREGTGDVGGRENEKGWKDARGKPATREQYWGRGGDVRGCGSSSTRPRVESGDTTLKKTGRWKADILGNRKSTFSRVPILYNSMGVPASTLADVNLNKRAGNLRPRERPKT
ncbi:hypothetical protein BC826DRAFT_972502 [Russula brevipes]|nr:hypothetical protein BC826DRAFT_972502 [Russula brevipes]